MRSIIKKNLWLGVDKTCPTCHNGSMMRNSEMRENLENEMWPDKIIELQPIGIDSANVIWEWYFWDHLI